MENEFKEAIKGKLAAMAQEQKKLEERYPPNPPNSACDNAYVKGILIENSFEPRVGELHELFAVEHEKLYVWTHDKDEYSSIIIRVDPTVKDIPFWKTIGSVLWLAIQYSDAFSDASTDVLEYKWLYYFNPQKKLAEQTFGNLKQFESIKDGRILKATDLGNLAAIIELMLRDDKAYTALMLLCNSFKQHSLCLICELSEHPYHDHLSEEPEIWEHPAIISDLESAIVQACRSVEGILGEPPNSSKQSAVLRHKAKWRQLTGIDPEATYEKANKPYFDFYYELFFQLRNPSAHSYGNIHYDLEKAKAVQAQCFAAIIIRGYIDNHVLPIEQAQTQLCFNTELLSRVKEEYSTEHTQ